MAQDPAGDGEQPVAQGGGAGPVAVVGVPADEGLQHDREGAGEQAGPGPDGVDGVISGG